MTADPEPEFSIRLGGVRNKHTLMLVIVKCVGVASYLWLLNTQVEEDLYEYTFYRIWIGFSTCTEKYHNISEINLRLFLLCKSYITTETNPEYMYSCVQFNT